MKSRLAVASILACAALTTAQVSFLDAQNLTAGAGAQDASDIAIGDIDGDGNPDLIVANRGGSAAAADGSVVVLLGDGQGGFGDATAIHAGNLDRPIALALGDLEGDDDLDIVVVTLGSDGVIAFFNAGDGTFPDFESAAVGNSPEHVALGDFDGDTRLDILVSTREDDAVTVILNDGTRRFDPGAIFDTPIIVVSQRTEPQGVAVGNFDGDSKLDGAVVLLRQDQVAILIGDGTGRFADPPSKIAVGATATGDADPRAIVAADFNGDGDVDLAVANSVGDSVTTLLGNGAGGFSNLGDTPAGNDPRDIAAADLDGDGRLDLAFANFEGDEVTVLRGKGDGTFEAGPAFKVGSGPFGVAAGDLDGAGALDLAAANQESDNISLLVAGETATDAIDDALSGAECGGANCGPLGLAQLALTLACIAALKRVRRGPL